MTQKINYTYAVGRRKTAVCRTRLYKGKGESTANGKEVSEYFPGESAKNLYLKPLRLAKVEDKYYFSAKSAGGGKEAQLDALALALSRALTKIDPEKHKKILRKAGLLTRDSRERQRRMVGTGGKARREKQSPKR